MIGTLFAMITAADPRWWELNFSQLGVGAGSWAFNGTLIVAGLLVATLGSYVGRDLHRIRGDDAIGRIAWVVVLWALAGLALAAVELLPVHVTAIGHNAAAFGSLVLFLAAAIATTLVMPGPPKPLVVTTGIIVIAVIVAIVLYVPFRVYSIAGMEAAVIGLALLWMTALLRTLAALSRDESRPSDRPLLRRARRRAA